MIGSRLDLMLEELRRNCAPGALMRVNSAQGTVELADGMIVCRRVDSHGDVVALSGLRFDVLIEHRSFAGSADILQVIRAQVLR
jgi:hypothetical protein